jgi:hypothetical protein
MFHANFLLFNKEKGRGFCLKPSGLGRFGFNGERVQALVHEILERIIHKPVPCHGGCANKGLRRDAHPEVGAIAGAVGARMAMVLVALIKHFELAGLQDLLQALLQLLGGGGVSHGVGVLVLSATK